MCSCFESLLYLLNPARSGRLSDIYNDPPPFSYYWMIDISIRDIAKWEFVAALSCFWKWQNYIIITLLFSIDCGCIAQRSNVHTFSKMLYSCSLKIRSLTLSQRVNLHCLIVCDQKKRKKKQKCEWLSVIIIIVDSFEVYLVLGDSIKETTNAWNI